MALLRRINKMRYICDCDAQIENNIIRHTGNCYPIEESKCEIDGQCYTCKVLAKYERGM